MPDPDALPDDIYGRTVRRGRDLITRTSSLIGPDAADPAMRFAGNGLDRQSCHLQAGTQQFGLPLAGVWGVFPQYIGRENELRTLEERVNGCMERSMNGRAMAPAFEEAARTLEPRLRLVKVSIEEAPQLAAERAIRSIPTLALFADGREVARQAGALAARGIIAWAGAKAAACASAMQNRIGTGSLLQSAGERT